MQKKTYQRPEIKEVKLIMEDTFLTACRSSSSSRTNARTSSTRSSRRNCSCCRATYSAS